MSKSKNDITSKKELLRYLRGEMADQEAHRFEKAALDDPFLTDALEGYENMQADEIEKDIKSLQVQIARERKPVYIWYAAAVALLLIVSTVTWNYVSNSGPENLSQQYEDPASDSTKNAENKLPEPSDRIEQKSSTTGQAEEEAGAVNRTKTAIPEPRKESMSRDSEGVGQSIQPIATPAPKQESRQAYETEASEDLEIETIPEKALKESSQSDRMIKNKKSEEAVGLRSAAQPASVAAASDDVVREPAVVRKIGGTVISEEGDPLPGVNIIIKNKARGTTTDLDGYFDLEVGPDDSSLVASFIGMSSSEISLDDSTDSLTITLQEDVSSLSEVVVVGYGMREALSDQSPGPLGGMSEFRAYVEKNMSNPDEQQGKVVLKVSLDEFGSINDVEAKRSLSAAHTREAIRLVKEYRGFQPAIRDGQAYPASLRIRIWFR